MGTRLYKKWISIFAAFSLLILLLTACSSAVEPAGADSSAGSSGTETSESTTTTGTGSMDLTTAEEAEPEPTTEGASTTAGTTQPVAGAPDPTGPAATTEKPTTTKKPTSSQSASQSAGGGSTTTTQPSASGTTMQFRQPGDKNTLGVWWWDISSIKGVSGTRYLDFLAANGASEIYLCVDGMRESGGTSYADVRAFVKQAKALGMRVAALSGDVAWINPGNTGFTSYVNKVNGYQEAASADEKFYAMHLDVEPHQHSDFSDNRAKVMQWFADFVLEKAVPAAEEAGMLLEWDIPFWLEDTVEDGSGRTIVLAELMAKSCDTIAIMSYRDTAEAMYNVSKEEIAFAQEYGCKIILGAETKSSEGDPVSYMEEGKAVMASELGKLNAMLLQAFPDRNFGIAVHQVRTWYSLQD